MSDDIEKIVKQKMKLEETVKELKEKLEEANYHKDFYKKEVEKYKDKIDEACKILVKHELVFYKRRGIFKRKRRFNI